MLEKTTTVFNLDPAHPKVQHLANQPPGVWLDRVRLGFVQTLLDSSTKLHIIVRKWSPQVAAQAPKNRFSANFNALIELEFSHLSGKYIQFIESGKILDELFHMAQTIWYREVGLDIQIYFIIYEFVKFIL